MAKVWIVKYQGTTHYIPKEQCETSSKAAEIIGCKAGVNCTVKTAITPPDMSAQEWIAQQTATAPTPTTPTTPTTPVTTTPTTTTPTTTTPTTTTPTTAAISPYDYLSPYQMTQYAKMAKGLEAGALARGAEKVGIDYTEEQWHDYLDYLAQRKLYPNLPVVGGVIDFLKRRDELVANYEDYTRGYTNEDLRRYNLWIDWSQKYGELGDWLATDIYDWLANPDLAQQQLDKWKQLATTEELEQLELEQYAIDPAEEARRREEAYKEGRYAAKERYREPVRLSETFAAWIGKQGDVSQALKGYIEKEYPSLRTEYQAGLPPITGYPTREAARVESVRRERGFEAWLGEKRPEVREEYYMQRPAERGERLWMQQPTLRAVNW